MTSAPDPASIDVTATGGHGTTRDSAVERVPVEMTLSREQLAVATAWQETGRVQITRTVVTERRTIEVDVRREELSITTSQSTDPIDVAHTETPQVDSGADVAERPPLVIVLREEVVEAPVLRVRPYEQVTIRVDRLVTEVEITDTVRSEHLDPDVIS